MDLSDVLMSKRVPYVEIARRAGISRTTLLKIRRSPEEAQLRKLRAICQAMGYNLVLSLEPMSNERIDNATD